MSANTLNENVSYSMVIGEGREIREDSTKR